MTQVEVVALVEVPQATYAGWETGRATPNTHWFCALAEFLGVAEADVATLCASPFVVDYGGWPPFGQFVGARRQELRLSRPALASLVGVAPSTIVSWELGYRVPVAKVLARMAAVLGVDTASLVSALPRRAATTTLGALILSRQRELGLRSLDIARRTGTTEATVSRWVQGRSNPMPSNLRRLAAALELSYQDVVEAVGHAA